MKIVFINPSLRPESKRRQLPVGLAYIMTAAKKAGFDFELIDMDIDHLSMDDLEKIMLEKKYDVYAVGCIVTGFKFVKQISGIAKKINPCSIIIAGNSVADSIPTIILENTDVDIAVIGEGDITVVELLNALEGKNDIAQVKGIAFKNDDKVIFTERRTAVPNIDLLGFPDWRIFDLNKYNEYSKINVNVFSQESVLSFPLNSARGCPYNCTFCYHVFKKDRYRRYSEQAILQEIRRLHFDYNCNFISFWDELTFPTIESVKERIKNLENLNFKFGWDAPIRGDLFKKEHLGLVKSLKALGCDNLAFSLENANPEILKTMNKKMDVSQFVEQAKVLWDGGIVPLTSIVLGYPQETPESINQTLEICEKCNIYPSVGFLLPLPGTPIYDWAKTNGRIINEVEYLERIGDRQDFHINLTKMEDQEFLDIVTKKLCVLAKKMGLKLDSVFKTSTYQKPKDIK